MDSIPFLFFLFFSFSLSFVVLLFYLSISSALTIENSEMSSTTTSLQLQGSAESQPLSSLRIKSLKVCITIYTGAITHCLIYHLSLCVFMFNLLSKSYRDPLSILKFLRQINLQSLLISLDESLFHLSDVFATFPIQIIIFLHL